MDTIVACATGPEASALAVVRLSGPQALEIAQALARGTGFHEPRRMQLMRIYDTEGALDHCLAVAFHGPNSFTGEDVVEFHVHGGPGLVRAVVSACVALKARHAEPGEFTRRAYLAGKLDLIEAEAVAARAGAASARAARWAESGVSGRLRHFARGIEEELTTLRAVVEGWLDFDPEELGDTDQRQLVVRVQAVADRLDQAAATAQRCLPVFDAPIVVLAGPVNAGKSSLFNALVGHDRALVSAEAGTTRDWLEAELSLPGGTIRLRDSAGLRDADGAVEAAGIARAKDLQAHADLVLWCVAPEQDNPAPLGAFLVPTMGDLPGASQGAVCAHTGAGLDALLDQMDALLLGHAVADSEAGVATSRRQVDWLEAAAKNAGDAAQTIAQNQLELAASDLRGACEALAELTGLQEPDEAMLDALFGQFCLGK